MALAEAEGSLTTDPSRAAAKARALLLSWPQNPAAHRLLAKALERMGQPSEARNAKAMAVTLSRHVPAIGEAHRAVLAGQPAAAIETLQSHLARHPDDPVALLVQGEALARTGRLSAAVSSFEAALAFMPEYREARIALVRAHYQRFDPRAALDGLALLLEPETRDVALLRWQAALLAEVGDHERAEAVHRRLLEIAPNDPAVLVGFGDLQRTLGQTSEAERAYRKALVAAPGLGAPWWSLTTLLGGQLDSADRTALKAAFDEARNPADRLYLAFAEGTVADKAGDHERAFALLSEANRLRRAQLSYDGNAFARRMEDLEANLDRSFFADREDWGDLSDAPIFIVGMPRSGSTLVEQILAGHSQVTAGGEMPIVTSLLREAAASAGLDPERDIVELLGTLTASDCTRLGADYLKRARDRCGRARARFTDKLPHNWAELAFIHLILPNARIVDIRRNALDCCVSNFALLFQPGHPASYDLIEIADYYLTYVRAMEWCGKVMPEVIQLVRYEALVEDAEGETRALLEFLGLEFESGCLELGTEGRVIATASAEQARRPINRSSLDGWKRFDPWLGGLKEALAPLHRDRGHGNERHLPIGRN